MMYAKDFDKSNQVALCSRNPSITSDNNLSLKDILTKLTDQMRSIAATYRFPHVLDQLKGQQVDFSKHVYIPEVDKVTGKILHHRENHNHILKRITKHTREGSPADVKVHRFCEPMLRDKPCTYIVMVFLFQAISLFFLIQIFFNTALYFYSLD